MTELVVTVAACGLLLGVLTPALRMAGERSKTDVCLSNLRTLGMAVRMYADEVGTLPGGLHPAVSRGMLDPNIPPEYQSGQLEWLLHSVLGDAINDRVITCPVMAKINPNATFDRFFEVTGRRVYPVHYVVNNVGTNDGGGNLRSTSPPFYFGVALPYYPFPPPNRPLRYGEVANAELEWMIADAWYRPGGSSPYQELQQEGPYQTNWSGEAMPNFAPHLRRFASNYTFTSTDTRDAESSSIRLSKSDGSTNTVFFDGHAASVPSQTYRVGGFEILYGFRGTVNPAKVDPPPSSPAWSGVWR